MKITRGRIAAFLLGLCLAIPVAAKEQPVTGGTKYLNGTTSQVVSSQAGTLIGIFVASSTSCTIKLWNNTTNSGSVLVNTFGASAATWYPLPFIFNTGLYLEKTGTCDYTVSFN
jgi:hypothetical protein